MLYRSAKNVIRIHYLSFAQAGVHGRLEMKTQLAPGAGHIGKGGDGGKLPVLVTDDIPDKDVGKQMFFEESVNGR